MNFVLAIVISREGNMGKWLVTSIRHCKICQEKETSVPSARKLQGQKYHPTFINGVSIFNYSWLPYIGFIPNINDCVVFS